LVELPARQASSASAMRAAPFASHASHSALARLAQIAAPRWLNTCLYRSVAECLALRALALPARVVIGVGTSASDGEVIAHAWVECEGITCLATRGEAELETMSTPARHESAAAGSAS
jgi:hypothetical protein